MDKVLRVGEETRGCFLARAALALCLAFACACSTGAQVQDAGVLVDSGGASDAIAYHPCSSFCIRPSDCQVGFPDGEICPAGFLCATFFMCGSDGGAGDM
jgi:hypothetical protein